MDCRNVEDRIPDYLDDEMLISDMRFFLPHIRNCDKCRDELETQFLVKEGLLRLEAGEAFDLRRELNLLLEQSEASVNIYNGAQKALIIGGVLLVIVIAFFVLWLMKVDYVPW